VYEYPTWHVRVCFQASCSQHVTFLSVAIQMFAAFKTTHWLTGSFTFMPCFFSECYRVYRRLRRVLRRCLRNKWKGTCRWLLFVGCWLLFVGSCCPNGAFRIYRCYLWKKTGDAVWEATWMGGWLNQGCSGGGPDFGFTQDNSIPHINMWGGPKIMVPPNHSFLIGFSIVNHPFWGTSIFGNIHVY